MLRQNINLYSSFKTPTSQVRYLSWKHLILSSVAFLILLILSHLYNISDLYYQKYHLDNLNQTIVSLQTKFENKKAQYPAFFFSDNVAKTVSEQQRNMQLATQLMEKIANKTAFSEIFLSLGQIDVPGVWLTEINIEDDGNSIKLTGNALTMPELKSYFAQIEKNIFFKDDHLTLNNVEHEAKENYPDFQTYVISIAKVPHEKFNT